MDKLAIPFSDVGMLNLRKEIIKELSVDPTFKYLKKADEKRESKWDVNGENMILEDFPLQLDIELNTNCNLKCPMCPQSFNTPQSKIMQVWRAQDLIWEAARKGAESIKLQYRGEPLMYFHGLLIQIIKTAKRVGLYVHFNTNAMRLFPSLALDLIKEKLDKIICSVDSHRSEIYKKIRVGGNLDQVISNIKRLRDLRDLSESEKPIIRIQAVKQPLNKEEIDSGKYKAFWEEYADEIGIEEMFDFHDECENDAVLEDWHCGQLWQRLVILADGKVLPCCGGINYNTDEVYSVGNTYDNGISEIWKNEKMTKLRELHRAGKSHEIKMCRECRLRKKVIKMKIKKILEGK